jgi:PAS domain S-box-containing protein
MQQLEPGRLLAAMADALVVADAQGLVCLWNPAAERIFGFTPQEALGRSMDFIIPERLRGRHWEGYRETMASGITKYGTELLRVPALAKDGRQLSIAFTVALLAGPDGRPAAIVAVIRDETQRFQDERALRKRVAELEAAVAAHARPAS